MSKNSTDLAWNLETEWGLEGGLPFKLYGKWFKRQALVQLIFCMREIQHGLTGSPLD